jgi:hypothetical protein
VTAAVTTPPDNLEAARGLAFRMLIRSPFARASKWARAVVRIRPEGADVTHRALFAAELTSDGLFAAAHECTARRVRPGEVLVYVLRDDDETACAHFIVLDLAGGPRR